MRAVVRGCRQLQYPEAIAGLWLEDLLDAGVRLLTLGQYLAPTREHYPVERFISPEHFDEMARKAAGLAMDMLLNPVGAGQSVFVDPPVKTFINDTMAAKLGIPVKGMR